MSCVDERQVLDRRLPKVDQQDPDDDDARLNRTGRPKLLEPMLLVASQSEW